MTLYIFAVARARTRYFANKHYLIFLLSGEPVIKSWILTTWGPGGVKN